MGPTYGIIEMVKDACTIDSLKRKIHENYKNVNNLSNFFCIFYENDVKKA